MSNDIIGAFATVKWVDEGFEETILFLIGDSVEELDDHDSIIFERFGDSLKDITVVEASRQDWWDIKHGTNLGRGLYVSDTDGIELIKKNQQGE